MHYYAQIGENGVVHTISELSNRLIEVEAFDTRMIGTFYDTKTERFIGYKIVLTTDKTSITADGVDSATITATVYSWDDTIAKDFNDNIILEVDNQQVAVLPEDGIARIPFTSEEPGTYTIHTANEGKFIMQNGSVEVTVE